MRKLTTITIIIFSLLFPSTSFGEWKWLGKSEDGNGFYVDDGIKKHDGFVYYWIMTDLIRPNRLGIMSSKVYTQGDCNRLRFKEISGVFYTESMGRGTGESSTRPSQSWQYFSPDSVGGNLLRIVCDIVK